MIYFDIFGCTISSDFEIFLTNKISKPKSIDISIAKGKIPQAITNPVIAHSKCSISETEYLRVIDNVGKFYIAEGKTITYQKNIEIDNKTFSVYIKSHIFVILFTQRGEFILHASTINFNNKTIMFAGESGAGKSTATNCLINHGARFISDDISIVRNIETEPIIVNGWNHIKIWKNTAILQNLETTNLEKVLPNMEKYYKIEKSLPDVNNKVDYLYILKISDDNKYIKKEVLGIGKLQFILDNIFNNEYITSMNKHDSISKKALILASKIRIFILYRPKSNYNETEFLNILT